MSSTPNNLDSEPGNKQQVTRVVQIALVTDQPNALALVPSSLLQELPPTDQIDVIELRLIIDRFGKGVRVI
jgi:hypothetical protein